MLYRLAILIISLAFSALMKAEKPVVTPPLITEPELLAGNEFTFPSIIPAAGMELLNDEGESGIVDDMIDLAKSFLGTRYRRGGKNPGGFDCSGFTGYIFSQFGFSLGASSGSQYNQGEPIEKSDIIPGDLVFFNGRAVGSRVGHVGIAIDIDETTGVVTFIHSAIGGGIRIDKTSSPYYARRFLGARRLFLD